MHAVAFIAIALFVLFVLFAVTRANDVFRVSIRDGRCLVMRGHVPPGLMHEFEEVARRGNIPRGLLRAVRQGSTTRLVCYGIDEGSAQRLRNVFGAQRTSRLRPREPASGRNLGQRLGWEWLAWHLHQRNERPPRKG